MEKSRIRTIAFAFVLGVVLGGGTSFGYYSGLLKNQQSAHNDNLRALEESRRIADDYRRELDSTRRASGELVEELGKSLPEISRIASERERALAAVRVLRGVFENIKQIYNLWIN